MHGYDEIAVRIRTTGARNVPGRVRRQLELRKRRGGRHTVLPAGLRNDFVMIDCRRRLALLFSDAPQRQMRGRGWQQLNTSFKVGNGSVSLM